MFTDISPRKKLISTPLWPTYQVRYMSGGHVMEAEKNVAPFLH